MSALPAEAKSVGARVARLRAERGLSQRALARAAAITPTYLSRIERGERQPSIRVLRRFATPLGVSVEYLEHGAGPSAAESELVRLVTALHECLRSLEQAVAIARHALAAGNGNDAARTGFETSAQTVAPRCSPRPRACRDHKPGSAEQL